MIRLSAFILLIFLIVFTKGDERTTTEKLIFCSYNTFRPYQPTFEIESLDPSLCTHIIYHNAEIDEHNCGIKSRFEYFDHYEEDGLGLYNRTMNLKEKNPDLKVILGITGFFNSFWEKYRRSPETLTSEFAKNAVRYLQLYGFDGVDIGRVHHHYMTNFFSAIRQEFDKHGYILIMFLPPLESSAQEQSVITTDVAEPYNFLIVGSYWQLNKNSTAVLSPLLELKKQVSNFLEVGIQPEKLIVSIPAFAMPYKLRSINDTGISAERDGDEGESLLGKIFISYYELMQKLNNTADGWVLTRDNSTGMMYGHSKSLLWISYEDTVSVEAKAQYIIQNNLAGASVLSVDVDDFIGYNAEGLTFPLTRTVYHALRGTYEKDLI